MSEHRDLLVEIGTEELPPKALRRLSEAFAGEMARALEAADLAHGQITPYATPRRLALLVDQLPFSQPGREVERRGPALTAAFDEEGRPTKAAQGFARSCGVEVDTLDTLETPKGGWLVYRTHQEGRSTRELVPELVRTALERLPIPRRMRWGAGEEQFVRPVHWVVLLLGEDVIDARILDVAAGRETRGHRFHRPEPIRVGEPRAYAPLLASEGHVMAKFEARREAIRAQVVEAATGVNGQAVIDEQLLDEVTAMVEWPVTIVGAFDQQFLELPPEVVVTAMKVHQKCFPVIDDAGALKPYFATVSNIESKQPEVVRAGYERVIRPRLADADFFWRQDRSQPLEQRLERLKSVVFQRKLGTLYDKTQRTMALAGVVADQLGAERAQAVRAAELAKCDLVTEMVGEFPELQGVMGDYYARHDGEPKAVARALEEQYRPRFAGDGLAQTPAGQCVAIADRADTLVGLFGIGEPPSGEKDPFGLRRAGLGMVRTIIEQGLELDLVVVLEAAADAYGNSADVGEQFRDPSHRRQVVQEVFDFVMERLRVYYEDQGVGHDVFEAVRTREPSQPLDFDARVRAVTAFRALPEAESLAAANKRISNILRQAQEAVPTEVDERLLVEDQERFLAERLPELEEELEPLFEVHDYTHVMRQLAGLRTPVDAFFDAVLVMSDDTALRRNRLALLNRLRNLFLRVADLSRLQT